MNPRVSVLCSTLALAALAGTPALAAPAPKPNIIFILTDDLGYGDIGVFFQNARRAANNRSEPWHSTPRLDALAAEGLQIPQHYCPAPVCAPSRASLLLGVTQGHANVRDNQFDKVLENNHTVATVLKQAGYATAAIGKWGLQGKEAVGLPHGFTSHPESRGFDYYFGYIPHGAGHAHYPKEDGKRLFDSDQNVVKLYDGCYTTDLFTARAKKWIVDQKKTRPNQPFFLYLAYDTPHAKLQYPPAPFPAGGGLKGGVQWVGQPGHMINTASGAKDSYCYPDYASATWDDDKNPATPEKPWPDVYKRYASDVRRIDDCVGDIGQLLKDLKVDDNTLVIFTSDNGPSQESYLPEENNPNFFNSFGPFDGIKRDVWEGGFRVGALARWPGHIPPATVSQTPSGFWDWLPTFAELAGVPVPARSDGASLVPTLLGAGAQKPSQIYTEYFVAGKTPAYNEFQPAHQGRFRRQMQALRIGDYIGVRYDIKSHADPFEIYNIVQDPQEKNNLANDPAYANLQKELHDKVLGLRRPDAEAPRPYDNELIPAVEVAKPAPGVTWKTVEGSSPWVSRIDDAKASANGVAPAPNPAAVPAGKDESVLFSGYIEVPKDGNYTFSLTADAGALLRLHDATIIDADFGYKPGTEVSGSVLLKAGRHPFRLYYTKNNKENASLSLKWSSNEIAKQEIPASAYSH